MSFTRYKYTLPSEVPADTFTWQKSVRYARLKDNFDAAYALYQGTEEEVLVQITKNFESGLRFDRALFSVPYQASPAWSGVKTLVDNPLKFALFLCMVLQTKTAKDIRKAYSDFSSKKPDMRIIEAALWACSDQQIALAPKKVLVKEGSQWVLKDPSGQQVSTPLPTPTPQEAESSSTPQEVEVAESPDVEATEEEEPVIPEVVVEPIADATSEVPSVVEEPVSVEVPILEVADHLPEVVVLPVVGMAVVDLTPPPQEESPPVSATPTVINPSSPASINADSDAPLIVGLDNLAGLPQLKADIAEILLLVKTPQDFLSSLMATVVASLQGIDAKLQVLIDTPSPSPIPAQAPIDLSPLISEIRKIDQAVKPLLGLPDVIKELRDLIQRSSDEVKIEIHRAKSEAMTTRKEIEILRKDLTDKISAGSNLPAPKPSSGDSFLESIAFLKGHGAKLNLSIGD